MGLLLPFRAAGLNEMLEFVVIFAGYLAASAALLVISDLLQTQV